MVKPYSKQLQFMVAAVTGMLVGQKLKNLLQLVS